MSWQIADQPDTPSTELGLVHDRSVLVRDLPLDIAIVFQVTAQNQSGEAASGRLRR